jgi:hypothetical protein
LEIEVSGVLRYSRFERAHCGASLLGLILALLASGSVQAQVPPSAAEIATYTGLLAAAHRNDPGEIARLAAAGADLGVRDGRRRTAVHVAAHAGARDALRALAKAGSDMNALDAQRYDAVTIAAVNDDHETVKVALELGCRAGNITSPYDGTALIAAAHLGHDGVVSTLIAAGAPLDHVNNLGWTALIEAVILGNGGPRHVATVKALVTAGASKTIADRQGVTPLAHARARGYSQMIELLQ